MNDDARGRTSTSSNSPAHTSRRQAVPADRWRVVVAAGLAVFMATLDMSAVNLALPTIAADFSSSVALTQWVVLAYLLPLIGLALPTGRWVDRISTRRAFIGAAAGFALTAAIAGVAPGMPVLIAARLIQGCFGAVLLALAPLLPTVAVRPARRGRAMAVMTTIGPLGVITGPALGGWIISTVGWPWVFALALRSP